MLKKESFVLVLNQKILNFILRRHTKQVLAYEPTYLHSRVLQDTAAVIEFYFNTISNGINSLVVMLVALIVLYRVNGYILLSLVVFFPVYTFIYVMFKERIFISSKRVMEASNDCFSVRNNIYANYLEVKVRKRESEVKKRLKVKEDILMTSIKKNFLLNFTLSTIKIGTNSIFQFSCFAVGGIAVINGYITLGVFTYIIQYFSMLLNTVEDFFNLGTSYQGYRASLMRLNEILEIEEEPDGEVQLESIDSIELNNVNYKHHHEAPYLYSEGVNYTFNPNNLYTILGENGVGKSTLFMLMTGIYKDKNLNGDIILNGLPIHSVDMNHFREKCISVMLQQSFTLGLTVQEYISSFLSQRDLQRMLSVECYKAIFACSQFNIMETMEKNFDYLSGGEKQLINLFICLTKDASLYILDEPTSNIFPDLRGNIIQLLQHVVAEGKIIVASTHDKELVAKSIPYVLK